jgi:hypothetical protein
MHNIKCAGLSHQYTHTDIAIDVEKNKNENDLLRGSLIVDKGFGLVYNFNIYDILFVFQ